MIKKFNNFLLESKIPLKTLKSLIKLLNKRFDIKNTPVFFAKSINKYFNFDNFLFVSKIEFSENIKDIRHVYIFLNGKCLDGEGFCTKNDIIEKFEMSSETFNDFTFIGNLDKLNSIKSETSLSQKEIVEIEHLIRQFSQLY